MKRASGLTDQADAQKEAYQIDAVGLVCPLPILRLKKRIQNLPTGTLVDFLTDDPSGRKDLETFCDLTGHRIERAEEEPGNVMRYRISLS